ncbi:MAG: DndE family protein [Chloroflexi bacterium]|uniref:DndE family protein n=1 Tax=Candidatus Chlorohelix allophototropha TaxID=3003348 RepID=A0A8T7M4B1_9CHLR|nr:DndE family protein [Chloroflexota bacterium]WJW70068.1 DndE family protein [Chloroflexota bacterium L227-S17]
MKLKYKVYLSREVSSRLSLLASRLGMLPNLICRIGFCLSLEEPTIPDPRQFSGDKDGKEFNRYTLTGDWELLFNSLLKQRLAKDGLDPIADFDDQFSAHLGRGVLLLYDRVKSLKELRGRDNLLMRVRIN